MRLCPLIAYNQLEDIDDYELKSKIITNCNKSNKGNEYDAEIRNGGGGGDWKTYSGQVVREDSEKVIFKQRPEE